MDSVLFSSSSPHWGTPPLFLKNLTAALNVQITLDPCARNATEAKAEKFYTPKQNGLLNTWENHNVWCNPPYGREILQWAKKAVKEFKRGATVLFLGPARTDTEWFHTLWDYTHTLYLVKGRLKFIDLDNPTGKLVSAPFPSMVLYLKSTLITSALSTKRVDSNGNLL